MLTLNHEDKGSFGLPWGIVSYLFGLIAALFIILAFAFSGNYVHNKVMGYCLLSDSSDILNSYFYLSSFQKNQIEFGRNIELYMALGMPASILVYERVN